MTVTWLQYPGTDLRAELASTGLECAGLCFWVVAETQLAEGGSWDRCTVCHGEEEAWEPAACLSLQPERLLREALHSPVDKRGLGWVGLGEWMD